MPSKQSAASALAPLLDSSTAGELIPELVRHGLQQLIEPEVAAVLGAERHERSDDRFGYRNGYLPRLLTTQAGDIYLHFPPNCQAAATSPGSSSPAAAWIRPSMEW